MCSAVRMCLAITLICLAASCAQKAAPSAHQPGRVVPEVDFDAIPLRPDPARLRELGLEPADIESPVPIHRPRPEFPEGEPLRGGVVQLRCVIEADGHVDRCEVQRSKSPKFAFVSLAAVTRWKYTPCRINGQPRSVYVRI